MEDRQVGRGWRRSRFVVGLVVLTVTACIAGCGGGGEDEGPVEGLPARGTVTLPAGSDMVLSRCRVMSVLGTTSVEEDGSFTAAELAEGEALVALLDQQGRLRLLGYADPARDTGEISPRQTAIALLFWATGAWMLPESEWTRARELIAADPATQTLTEVVARRVAANPEALTGDAELKAAIQTAVDALIPPEARPSGRTTAGRSPAEIESGLYQNESGVTVYPNDKGDGVLLRNRYRRHAWYYLYRTDYWPLKGEKTSVNPWVLVSDGYVSATNGMGGTLALIYDLVVGNVPYKDADTVVDLPILPAGSKRTAYTIVLVGPGLLETNNQLLKEKPEYAVWQGGAFKMGALGFFKDLLFPVAFAFVGSVEIKNADAIQAATNIADTLTQGGLDVSTTIMGGGDSVALVTTVCKALVTNGNLRDAVAKHVFEMLKKNGYKPAEGRLGDFLKLVSRVLSFLDLTTLVADLGHVAVDYGVSTRYVSFFVNVQQNVAFHPDEPKVNTGDSVPLSVTYGNVYGEKFAYHFMTAGEWGTLVGSNLNPQPSHRMKGNDLWLDNPNVEYEARADAEGNKTEEIHVEVFRRDDDKNEYVGEDDVTVKIFDPPYGLFRNPEGTQDIWADDDVFVYLNGELIFANEDYSAQEVGPIELETAKKGDVLRVVARNYGPGWGRAELTPVYLVRGDKWVLVHEGKVLDWQQFNYNVDDFVDVSITIPF